MTTEPHVDVAVAADDEREVNDGSITGRAMAFAAEFAEHQPTPLEMGYVAVWLAFGEAAARLRACARKHRDTAHLEETAASLDRLAARTRVLAEATVNVEVAADEPELVRHAHRELERAGEHDDWFVESVLASVRGFIAGRHSGSSAEQAARYVYDLLRHRPLTALTRDPAEWEDRSEISGTPLWQNIRDPRAMSTDGGRTYWLTDDEANEVGDKPRYYSAEPQEAGR
ncbi:hypothetical protein [Saccharothrix xinjiangensis]|uniref:Uncharacterized protein n=1 Tax=Saccharothrix xinjiangensis TaxID=204798 RepID=A0ABV9XWK8_9PSEU